MRKLLPVAINPAAGSVVPAGSVVTLTFVVWPQICP
jgi:hypothetical protein